MKEAFLSQLVQVGFMLLSILLTAAVAYLFPKLNSLLEKKIGETAYGKFKQYAWATVGWLAQNPVFADWAGLDKTDRAIAELTQYANKHGIPVTYEEIDKVIEATYLAIKQGATQSGFAAEELAG
jgi:hypothetical protein